MNYIYVLTESGSDYNNEIILSFSEMNEESKDIVQKYLYSLLFKTEKGYSEDEVKVLVDELYKRYVLYVEDYYFIIRCVPFNIEVLSE